MNLQIYLNQCQKRVNKTLVANLPTVNKTPKELHSAMRYAVLNGGKRIRSALIYATGEALGADKKMLDTASAAIELIHAFSLVHDDLPAIDNDALRRGKPSCHVAFGEATAILAGDALLVLAFEILTNRNTHLSADTHLKMVKLLSHYTGSCGMAGGEALDAAVTDKNITLQKLALIYKLKTSYLICASVLLGAMAADCNRPKVLTNLEKFGLYLGLAFQIHDDIIGIETDTKLLGKPQGSDVLNHKPTYPKLLGMQKAKNSEARCFKLATHFLKQSGIENEKLLALSELVISRKF